jgi:hypothetical protein
MRARTRLLALVALVLAAVAAVLVYAGRRPKQAPPGVTRAIVQDFERGPSIKKWPKDSPGVAEISTEWHADGARSLKIGPGVMAATGDLAVGDFRPFSVLKIAVHNPTDRTAELGLELQDEFGEFADRYQGSFGVLPGDHTLELDFSGGLWRGEENRPYRGEHKTPLDIAKVTRIGFNNHGPVTVYVDAVELEKRAPIAAPGAFAFDFAKDGTPVMPQSTGVFESTLYTPERGYGMLGRTKAFLLLQTSYPSPLLGSGLGWEEGGFRVDLPAGGDYLGWIAFERGGFWEGEASSYEHAKLLVNGAVVHEHDFSPAGPHFFFEDTELTSLDEIESKVVRPAAAVARFAFKAQKGGNVFTLDLTRPSRSPLRVAGLFVAPDTAEGRAFLDAQDHLQSQAIAASYAPQDRGRRGHGRSAPEKDVVVEPLPPGFEVYPRDFPAHPAGAPLDEIVAPRGQKVAVHLGVYAKAALSIHAAASPLVREGGPTEALPAPVIRYGRYLPMRGTLPGPVWLEIHHYRPEPDFTVGPDLTRSLVVEYDLEGKGRGTFTSTITLTGGPEPIVVPVRIRAVDVALPPIPIPVGLFMNALPFRPGAVGEPAWWRMQEELLAEQQRAGINCLTGGPGLDHPEHPAPGAPDASAHYLDLAKKHGPVLAVVAYGGFLPALNHHVGPPSDIAETVARYDVPHFVKSFDEPATDQELEAAIALVAPATHAGLKTMGFLTTDAKLSSGFERLVAAAYAVAFRRHDPAELAKREAKGQHIWIYNNGLDRYGMGLHLFRNLRAGAEGRLEWIGVLTQGFAFDNLDGRESAPEAWVVHDRFGVLPTPRWLAAREGLLDLRIRLALEAKVPKDDPALALFTMEGYGADKEKWSDAALTAAQKAMLERLDR